MHFFQIVNGKPEITAEAMHLQPVKELVQKDRSKNKSASKNELAAIWYLCSHRSPIVQYYTPERRVKEVKRMLGLPQRWKLQPYHRHIIDAYREVEESSPSIMVLKEIHQSLRISADAIKVMRGNLEKRLKLIENMPEPDEVSLSDTANEIMRMVKNLMEVGTKIPEAINRINELEEQIASEAKGAKKVRGGGVISPFELPPDED